MPFKDLNLHPEILRALEESGYTTPTPIQEEAIPAILKGSDMRASAQTGTGKTAAFLLPALNLLAERKQKQGEGKGPCILILVPTRELACQVAAQAIKYSKYLQRVKTVCIYGGVPYPAQNKELSRPYEILVATPGRLIDHLERGRISFSRLQMLILDEADRMLDMGFIEPVEKIAAATPKTRQTLLFSATLKGAVLNLSKRLLNDPLEISVAAEHAKHELIDQQMYYVDNIAHKYRLLDHFLKDESGQVIIFTATKRHADQLADKLNDMDHPTESLHGDMSQRERTRTLTKLRQGRCRILVATDVAARGIDVLTITRVINFDLPTNVEDYVHRIGRTGRAGGKGTALSFAEMRDVQKVKRIEKFTGQPVNVLTIEGLEPKLTPNTKAKPKGGPKRHFGKRSGNKHRFFKGKSKGFKPKSAAIN